MNFRDLIPTRIDVVDGFPFAQRNKLDRSRANAAIFTIVVLLMVPCLAPGQSVNDGWRLLEQQNQQRRENERQQQIWDIQRRQRVLAAELAQQQRNLKRLREAPASLLVPGESAEQRAARHQEARGAADEFHKTKWVKERPFSFSANMPQTPQIYYDAFIQRSDALALENELERAELHRRNYESEISELQRRLNALEAMRAQDQQAPQQQAEQQLSYQSAEQDSARQRAETETAEAYDKEFDESEAKAVALYDFASDPNSVGSKRMVEIEAMLKANNDPLYYDANKPLIIAQMVAREMRIPPKSEAQKVAWLTLRAEPRDIILTINGRAVRQEEIRNGEFAVPADETFTVVVSAKGYKSATRTLTLPVNCRESWDVELAK